MNAEAASATSPPAPLVVRWLGRVPYEPTWRAMQQFTATRVATTDDEMWLLEHEPVYTLGMNADPAHVLNPGDIPVIRIDRGGQVTYHGPGQLVIYPLIDLRRAHLGVRDLVTALESAAIDLAARHGIRAACRANAPGGSVDQAKFASVGLRRICTAVRHARGAACLCRREHGHWRGQLGFQRAPHTSGPNSSRLLCMM